MERAVIQAVAQCVAQIRATKAIKATKYLGEKVTVKAALKRHRHGKMPSKVSRRAGETIVVSIGRPNYAERAFIKACRRSGEALPVKKVQLKFQPQPRG